MRIDFDKELPNQAMFLLRNIPEITLSFGKIPYTVKTFHNIVSAEHITRIKIGPNTAILREDLVGILDRKLNKKIA